MFQAIRKQTKSARPVIWTIWVFLSIFCLSLVFMYAWGFFTSLKSNVEFRYNLFSIPRGMPWTWEWANYSTAFKSLFVPITLNGVRRNVYMPEMFFNSIMYAFSGAFIGAFTTWMMAYLFAKFPYKFSKFMYSFNIVLMTIPIIGALPSALFIKKALGLYDNWWYVITGGIHFTGMYLMVFYAFHKGIGKDFSDAACVDGASNWTTMLRIIFPITAQMFFVVFLMSFIGRWNDYMTMVVWMPNHPTLAFGIYKFTTTTGTSTTWPPMQITASMILMVPILILFLCFQDYMMGNLRMGALKG